MEQNKNIINGPVDTGGGDFQVGDNYTILNVEGLPIVLQEYKNQLKEIEKFILSFKPKTAFELLINLEKRIENSGVVVCKLPIFVTIVNISILIIVVH